MPINERDELERVRIYGAEKRALTSRSVMKRKTVATAAVLAAGVLGVVLMLVRC